MHNVIIDNSIFIPPNPNPYCYHNNHCNHNTGSGSCKDSSDNCTGSDWLLHFHLPDNWAVNWPLEMTPTGMRTGSPHWRAEAFGEILDKHRMAVAADNNHPGNTLGRRTHRRCTGCSLGTGCNLGTDNCNCKKGTAGSDTLTVGSAEHRPLQMSHWSWMKTESARWKGKRPGKILGLEIPESSTGCCLDTGSCSYTKDTETGCYIRKVCSYPCLFPGILEKDNRIVQLKSKMDFGLPGRSKGSVGCWYAL